MRASSDRTQSLLGVKLYSPSGGRPADWSRGHIPSAAIAAHGIASAAGRKRTRNAACRLFPCHPVQQHGRAAYGSVESRSDGRLRRTDCGRPTSGGGLVEIAEHAGGEGDEDAGQRAAGDVTEASSTPGLRSPAAVRSSSLHGHTPPVCCGGDPRASAACHRRRSAPKTRAVDTRRPQRQRWHFRHFPAPAR